MYRYKESNLHIKIIYLPCSALVYCLFAALGNCFSVLDMQNADIKVTETLSFSSQKSTEMFTDNEKSSLFRFFWKISNWW